MSIRMKPHEAAGLKIFCEVMSEELATELIEFRRRRKAEVTPRIAKSLVERYKAYGNVEKAVEEQMQRNWIGFDPDWMKKPGMFTDQHNPTPRPSANYGPAEVVIPKQLTEEEKESRRAMMQRMREKGVIGAGRTMQ